MAEHVCKIIEKSDTVTIEYFDDMGRWMWCHVKKPGTLKEKVEAHEIIYCPYCGERLPVKEA